MHEDIIKAIFERYAAVNTDKRYYVFAFKHENRMLIQVNDKYSSGFDRGVKYHPHIKELCLHSGYYIPDFLNIISEYE